MHNEALTELTDRELTVVTLLVHLYFIVCISQMSITKPDLSKFIGYESRIYQNSLITNRDLVPFFQFRNLFDLDSDIQLRFIHEFSIYPFLYLSMYTFLFTYLSIFLFASLVQCLNYSIKE